MYDVLLSAQVYKQLSKISRDISERIKFKVHNHLASDPRKLGRPLRHPFKGSYRYECYDDYRVIYKIIEAEKTIDILAVGHRKDIYRSFT